MAFEGQDLVMTGRMACRICGTRIEATPGGLCPFCDGMVRCKDLLALAEYARVCETHEAASRGELNTDYRNTWVRRAADCRMRSLVLPLCSVIAKQDKEG
mgnify:CR=1 FL=1